MEQRLHALEQHVGTLRESTAANGVQIQSLKDAVDELTPAVRELTATINKSKGAIWFAGGMGGVIGWAISLVKGH
jgi:chromosome segregation ATPase